MSDKSPDVRVYGTLFGTVNLCLSCATGLKLGTRRTHTLKTSAYKPCDACEDITGLRLRIGMLEMPKR